MTIFEQKVIDFIQSRAISIKSKSENIISHRLKGGPLWIFGMFPRDERKPVCLRIQEISQPLSGITVTIISSDTALT